MNSQRPRAAAVIPSAGFGKRLGSRKKAFLELNGRPMLAHTLRPFEDSSFVDAVVVVVPPGDVEMCVEEVITKFGFKKVLKVVEGGKERQDSVRNGFEVIKDSFDIVLVHDAARPLVTVKLIDEVIAAVIKHKAAIPGIKPKDTIKEVSDGRVKATIDRDKLISVQTPQGFAVDVLKKAFDAALKDNYIGTDESSLVERLSIAVTVVEGLPENIKVTTPVDIAVAEGLLNGTTPVDITVVEELMEAKKFVAKELLKGREKLRENP
ncbi:MAG: 2-C-methyl-D-erythritol 4-phosphate cytidylyltransferase [Deltaproteobacteria bacterium]|nr:2-C-methyl-D-erythritol 4-phosphate cytidylyltransferase [Deltaproteobacteria bacterium]